LERQRSAFAQHRQLDGVDLDVAGGDVGVGVAFGPRLDDAFDRHAELRPKAVRLLEHHCVAEHHLRDTRRIAQIDEDDSTVVTTPRHPSGKCDRLIHISGPQRTGGMAAQHENSSRKGDGTD